MGFNFNNRSNEYSLYNNVTSEFINLYGFTTSYIKTTKVNLDHIYNEIQNLRADNTSVFNINVYPENTAGYGDQNDLLSKFGILSFDSINLYVSASMISTVYPDVNFKNAISDLIVLPSKKVIEIIDIENQVPGVNNMFVYNNTKNVFLLKCKSYNFNHDEIVITDPNLTTDIPDFSHLFDLADKNVEKAEQDAQSTLVKTYDDVFGSLG